MDEFFHRPRDSAMNSVGGAVFFLYAFSSMITVLIPDSCCVSTLHTTRCEAGYGGEYWPLIYDTWVLKVAEKVFEHSGRNAQVIAYEVASYVIDLLGPLGQSSPALRETVF